MKITSINNENYEYKHNSTSSCLTTFWSWNFLLVETLLASICKHPKKKKQICHILTCIRLSQRLFRVTLEICEPSVTLTSHRGH
jgi:hypothetical protein